MRKIPKYSKPSQETVRNTYSIAYKTLRRNQEDQQYIQRFHHDLAQTPYPKRDAYWHIFMSAFRSFIARGVVSPECEPLESRYYTLKHYGRKLRRSFYITNRISKLGIKTKE